MQRCRGKREEWIGRGGISIVTVGTFEPSSLLTCKYILHRAKMQNIMCTRARTFSFSAGALPLDHTGRLRPPVHVAPVAALSGNKCLWFSPQLWFSNDVCSSPNHWRITNQSPIPGIQHILWADFLRGVPIYRRFSSKAQ